VDFGAGEATFQAGAPDLVDEVAGAEGGTAGVVEGGTAEGAETLGRGADGAIVDREVAAAVLPFGETDFGTWGMGVGEPDLDGTEVGGGGDEEGLVGTPGGTAGGTATGGCLEDSVEG
jgi:hypothetical protein